MIPEIICMIERSRVIEDFMVLHYWSKRRRFSSKGSNFRTLRRSWYLRCDNEVIRYSESTLNVLKFINEVFMRRIPNSGVVFQQGKIYIVKGFLTLSNRLEEKPWRKVPTRWSALVITELMCNLKDKWECMLIPRSVVEERSWGEHHLMSVG